MKKIHFLLLAFMFWATVASAQQNGVCISNDNSQPVASAILEVKSTTQGVLFPSLTSAQRDAIQNPAPGLMIYNTERYCQEFYTGTEWTSYTPAGTILPFAGEYTEVPKGWLLCDGLEYEKTTYPDLYLAIKSAWGENGSKFRVPDLRGVFLRGVNGSRTGTYADPDAGSRPAPYTGGNTNNSVGSFQEDVFSEHHHDIPYCVYDKNTWATAAINRPLVDDTGPRHEVYSGQTTANIGGTETRPSNAYVNYIIKF